MTIYHYMTRQPLTDHL